jgi:hypothetical protein
MDLSTPKYHPAADNNDMQKVLQADFEINQAFTLNTNVKLVPSESD